MRRYRSFRLEFLLPDGELPVLQLRPRRLNTFSLKLPS